MKKTNSNQFKPPISIDFNRNNHCLLCIVFALATSLTLFNCTTVLSQSASIQIFPELAASSSFGVKHSMTARALQTEKLLQNPAPAELKSARTFGDALEVLHGLGIDWIVTSSALDDAVELTEEWYSGLMQVSQAEDLLVYSLEEVNACYDITPTGAIRIISLDEKDDPVHFQTIVYDVSAFAPDFQEAAALSEQVQSSIDRDTWEQAGGSAGCRPRVQGNRRLLIITAHYYTHRKVRRLLNDILSFGRTGSIGFLPTPSSPNQFHSSVVSQIVEAPSFSNHRFANPFDCYSMSHFSGGVF